MRLFDYSWFKKLFSWYSLYRIQHSCFYSVSADKSLNKNLQKGQIDQLVRICSNEKKMVVTQHFNSEFMDGAKAKKILQIFEKVINKLNSESLFEYPQMGLTLSCISLNFLLKKRNQKNFHHWYKLELVVYILYMAAWKLGLKILIGILGKFLKQLGSF